MIAVLERVSLLSWLPVLLQVLFHGTILAFHSLAARPGRRMGELAEATGLSVDEISRLLYALMVLGVIVPESRMPSSRCDSGDRRARS